MRRNPIAMGNEWAKWDLRLVLQEPARWWSAWGPDLDRLEHFASHLGEGYAKHVDAGYVAFGAAMVALFALTIG